MRSATRVIKEYWNVMELSCVLCQENLALELRLYDGNSLIALWPCADCLEALELSRQWRVRAPAWPPYR